MLNQFNYRFIIPIHLFSFCVVLFLLLLMVQLLNGHNLASNCLVSLTKIFNKEDYTLFITSNRR